MVEHLHAVVNLAVCVGPHLRLHLLANLHTSQTSLLSLVGLSEFLLLETLEEIGDVSSIYAHALCQITHQTVAVGHSVQVAEGIDTHCIHLLHLLLGGFLALALAFLVGCGGTHTEQGHQRQQYYLSLFHR